MFPKGYVIHYTETHPGFQKERTLCGKIVDYDYWNTGLSENEWGGTRACKQCLLKRMEDD